MLVSIKGICADEFLLSILASWTPCMPSLTPGFSAGSFLPVEIGSACLIAGRANAAHS